MERGGGVREMRENHSTSRLLACGKGKEERSEEDIHVEGESGGGRKGETERQKGGEGGTGTALGSNTGKWKESAQEMQSWCELEQQDRERSG